MDQEPRPAAHALSAVVRRLVATTPYIQIVASGAAKVYFDLIGNSPHVVDDQPLGPSGAIVFTMDDWSDGMLSIEEGLQYRQGMRKYVSSTGGDAAFPGQVIVQSVASQLSVGSGATQIGEVIKQLDFVPSGGTINTYLIANNSGNVFRITNPGTTNNWTIVDNPGSVPTDLVVHGGFIATAYDTGYSRSPNGTVWTASTTDADAFGTLNQNIYRADENIVYGATALDGSWDAGTVIGDNNSDINSLLALEQILMVGKTDGIYTVDAEGTSVQMTPELRTQRNANIAPVRAVATFNGDYYFRTLNGMIQISGADGQKRRVGFDQLVSPDIPAPATRTMTWDDRYLYAASESASVTIFRRSISGAWHVFWQGYSLAAVNHVAVSAVFGYPALFFSHNAPAVSKYIRLSTFPNPLQDTNYRYYTDNAVRIRMPRIGSSAAQMLIDRLDIQSRQLAAGVTITPYYSADGGAITQFGASAVSASPSATVTPTTAITCNFFDLYFELVTNSATTTPVLTGFTLHGVWRPGMRRTHQFTAAAAAYHGNNRGGAVKQSPVTTIANLQALRTQGTYAVVTDENGQSFSGVVTEVKRTMTKLVPPNTEPEHAIQFTVFEKAS